MSDDVRRAILCVSGGASVGASVIGIVYGAFGYHEIWPPLTAMVFGVALVSGWEMAWRGIKGAGLGE